MKKTVLVPVPDLNKCTGGAAASNSGVASVDQNQESQSTSNTSVVASVDPNQESQSTSNTSVVASVDQNQESQSTTNTSVVASLDQNQESQSITNASVALLDECPHPLPTCSPPRTRNVSIESVVQGNKMESAEHRKKELFQKIEGLNRKMRKMKQEAIPAHDHNKSSIAFSSRRSARVLHKTRIFNVYMESLIEQEKTASPSRGPDNKQVRVLKECKAIGLRPASALGPPPPRSSSLVPASALGLPPPRSSSLASASALGPPPPSRSSSLAPASALGPPPPPRTCYLAPASILGQPPPRTCYLAPASILGQPPPRASSPSLASSSRAFSPSLASILGPPPPRASSLDLDSKFSKKHF